MLPPPVRLEALALHCASHPSLPVPLRVFLCHCGCAVNSLPASAVQKTAEDFALTSAPCLAGKFFWYLLIVFLTLSYYTYYGMVSLATGPLMWLSLLALIAAGNEPAVCCPLPPA